MGLDIYLYRYDTPKEEIEKIEAEYEEKSEANWERLTGGKKYDDIPDDEKEIVRAANDKMAEEMGLDEYGEHPGKEKIERDSAKYPEHYFKMGYLRSSYNASGINRVLTNLIGVTLDDLFDHEGEEYACRPNWEAVRLNTEQAISKFDQSMEKDGAFNVMKLDRFGFHEEKLTHINSEEAALKVFREKRAEHKERKDKNDEMFANFSCLEGAFELGKEPLKVRAMINGFSTLFRTEPCIYIIYEADGLKWYREAMEIIVETCDWVLAQPDKQKYYIHWSG